jgi:hypothetical protein
LSDAPVTLDQSTESAPPAPSNRARVWTLIVACFGVALVISSMVAPRSR